MKKQQYNDNICGIWPLFCSVSAVARFIRENAYFYLAKHKSSVTYSVFNILKICLQICSLHENQTHSFRTQNQLLSLLNVSFYKYLQCIIHIFDVTQSDMVMICVQYLKRKDIFFLNQSPGTLYQFSLQNSEQKTYLKYLQYWPSYRHIDYV